MAWMPAGPNSSTSKCPGSRNRGRIFPSRDSIFPFLFLAVDSVRMGFLSGQAKQEITTKNKIHLFSGFIQRAQYGSLRAPFGIDG
jgi:hypothetical protein